MAENKHIQRAVLLLSQHRPQLAREELLHALAADAHDPAAHVWLARALHELKQSDEALREAVEAVRLAPDWEFPHAVLAEQLRDLDRLNLAEAAARESLRLDPQNAQRYALLASIFGDRGQWDEALQLVEQGLKYDAEEGWCLNLRSVALDQVGRTDEARINGERALMHRPQDASAHAVQGWHYIEKNNAPRALEHFREALRLDPQMDCVRPGLVKALKARYAVYRIVLTYLRWTRKYATIWSLLLPVMLLAMPLVASAYARDNRASFIILPALAILTLAMMINWCAEPLSNLMLVVNRYGWYALQRHERTGTILFGSLLALGLAWAVAALAGWQPAAGLTVFFAGLLLPTGAAFGAADPRKRRDLVIAVACLAAFGVFALWRWLVGDDGWQAIAGVYVLMGTFGFTMIASQVLAHNDP